MNPAIARGEASLIRALHARRRPSSIDLGLGQPTLLPNVRYFERATAWVAENGCGYSPNMGEPELRAAIAAHYAYPNLDGAANVCITTGSQEAVYVALRTLLDPAHDELLVVEPAFPVYGKIAEVEGIPLRRLALDPQAPDPFDPDLILAAVGPKTRAIVICSPCNPTGRVISRASAARIAAGLLARSGAPVYVLHDEIYRELIYTSDVGEFGKIYPYTVAVNSLSKSNALTGLRLGWAIAPAEVMPSFVKLHGWITSCASTFAQRVALEVFAARDLAGHRDWYAHQRTAVLATLNQLGLDYIEPEGAFYVCVRIGLANSRAFAEALIDECDVIAIPGDLFSPVLAGWLRTSFTGPIDQVCEGLRRIAEFSRADRAAGR